ncbi:MAG: type II secretion system secretin GspD [Pseudomonadales bacterium]|nr:type II secretion system secretin GspD [Pseudomonadales bacterium]
MLRLLTAAAILVLLTSCSNTATSTGGTAAGADTVPARSKVDASAPLSTSAAELAEANAEEGGAGEPTIYRGTDRQVKLPPVEEPIRFIGEDVSINFEKAPLSEVMHAIMGDILGLDYVVDMPIKGEVTLRTRTPIPRNELLAVLESLLQANGVVMIRGSDGRYLITSSVQGMKMSPGVSNPHSVAVGFSTIIVPLQYISAANMAEILQPVASPEAFVRVDNTRNLLMLAGTRAQLEGWLQIIATFDVDMLAGMSVGIFPLENSSVEEVNTALSALLASGGPEDEGGSWSQLLRVIPVARLNSILVVTPRAHYLDVVEKWIKRLDEAYYSEADMRLYVYPVQNTTAERLAKLLNSIYSGSMSQQATGSGDSGFSAGMGRGSGVAPGMSNETLGSSSSSGSMLSDSYQPSSNNSGDNRGGQISTVAIGAQGGGSLLGNVRVVADEENNALMIYSTGMQYRIIEKALEQLDTEATQVVIEASILEVTLTDKLRYGLEWTFSNDVGNQRTGTGLLTGAASAIPGIQVPGFSYAITNSVGDIKAVLNALSEDNLLNVISTPSITVLDNHDAYIHVGDQVPVVSGSTINDGGFATESVTYRDTGVQLNVRPSVNAGGLVTMQIEQSVTDVLPSTAGSDNPTFLERSIMTRVAVHSHQSVVLGGLIRENASNVESGVPFLHKLPVLGPLFGSVAKENRRTELLVIITPRAIYSEQDLREVSEEMRSQIRHMELIDMPAE